MSDKPLAVIVLAAGKGTRTKISMPKVLLPICGSPLLDFVLDAGQALEPRHTVVVLHHAKEMIEDALGPRFEREKMLIVDQGTAQEKARPGAAEEVFESKSWGETIYIHNVPAESEVRFGETAIRVDTVTWIDWPSQWLGLILQFSDLAGMCGNKLFLGRTLILDTVNQRFAVSR